MKKVRLFTQTAWFMASVFVLATTASCSSDDTAPVVEPENPDDPNTPEPKNKFFVAASQDGVTYFLTADDLESGTASIVGNGIEVSNSFTHLVSGTNNLITTRCAL